MEVSGQFHFPAALPAGKDPRYPLDMRLGGPQFLSGYSGRTKNPSIAPAGNRTPVFQPVA
jgi:hypothetical protein